MGGGGGTFGLNLIQAHLVRWKNSLFESKKHFFDVRPKKKCLWIKESFVNSKKISLIQKN